MVKVLVTGKANLDQTNIDGNTVLMTAVKNQVSQRFYFLLPS